MNGRLAAAAGPLFVGGMQACWLAAGFWLVAPPAGAGTLPIDWVLAGLPAGFALWRLSALLGARRRAAAASLAGLAWVLAAVLFGGRQGTEALGADQMAAAVAALGAFKAGPNPAQLAAAAAAAAWACGLRLAARPVDLERVLGEFQLGIMALLLVLFLASQWDLRPGPLTTLVVLFFISFFGAAAAARGRERGGRLPDGPRGPWAAVAVIHAALVIGMGLALAAAVTPEALALVLAALKAGWDAAVRLFAALMAFLARLLPQPELGVVPLPGGGAGPGAEAGPGPDLLRLPDAIRAVAQFLVAAFWVALLALSLWRIAAEVAAWLRRQAAGWDGAEVEVLGGALGEDLRRILNWVRQRLARVWGRLRAALGRRAAAPAQKAPEAAAVRRLYRRLLRGSAAGGCRRRKDQTPREFLARLSAWLPEAGPDLEHITAAYERVRYGAESPTAETLAALGRGMENVNRLIPRGTRAGRKKTAPDGGTDG